jgi:hypothetical protein
MPLSSYLTKALRWLRAGYPPRAPRHGYVPLIALAPGPDAQTEDPLDAAESLVLPTSSHPAGDPQCTEHDKAGLKRLGRKGSPSPRSAGRV